MSAASSPSGRNLRFKRGLSLLELLVVLIILAALAGLVMPHVSDLRLSIGGERKSPAQIATESTLRRVQAAIMGDESMPGLWQDLGGDEAALPLDIRELFIPRPGWPPVFDPNTRLGWRGPYVMDTGARDSADDPAILDGWGRPIVIQAPDADHIRLLSAGADGILSTPPGIAMPTLAACGDDMVLFLRTADTRP